MQNIFAYHSYNFWQIDIGSVSQISIKINFIEMLQAEGDKKTLNILSRSLQLIGAIHTLNNVCHSAQSSHSGEFNMQGKHTLAEFTLKH